MYFTCFRVSNLLDNISFSGLNLFPHLKHNIIFHNVGYKKLLRAAILNLGYAYPWGYARSWQGVRQTLNLLKIPRNSLLYHHKIDILFNPAKYKPIPIFYLYKKMINKGYQFNLGVRRYVKFWFRGYAGVLNPHLGVRRKVKFRLGGTRVSKGWEPLV